MNINKKCPRLNGMSHHNEREVNAIEGVNKYISKKVSRKCNN